MVGRFSLLILISASLFASASGQTLQTPSEAEKRRAAFWKSIGTTYRDTFLAASKLKPGQPVDDLHASLLGSAYFYANLGGCGGIEDPIDNGSYWRFPTKMGYGGTPGPEIRVAKATGVTSCKGYKTIADPRVYAKWAKK